jgi:hypothetical protein
LFIKVISLDLIIFADKYGTYYIYKIDVNTSSIELLNLSKGYRNDQLNFSSIIRREDNLVSYYSSAVDNCYSTEAINYKQPIDDDDVVGINCFDELLLRSEFISYARDNF